MTDLAPETVATELLKCADRVDLWLGLSCPAHTIPRPEIAALVTWARTTVPSPETISADRARNAAHSVGAEGLPEIDYHALIAAAFARTKAAQGTPRCVAFKAGAEWYREQALAALASRPAVDADKRDAERYRWLRENGDRGCTEKDGYGGQTLMMVSDLDAAIDAARHPAQREGE